MPDKPLQIASVAVVNSHGHVLVGRRNDSGKFTLPGGHMEEGETPVQGAARELKEEAGFDVHPDRLEPLGSDCITSERGEQIEVHGFKVRNDAATTPAGDPDEECSGWFFVAPGPTGLLPKELLSNLHAPRNTVLQRLGMQPVHDIEALERAEPVEKAISPELAAKIREWSASGKKYRRGIHREMMRPTHAQDRKIMVDAMRKETRTRIVDGERHFLLHRGTHSSDPTHTEDFDTVTYHKPVSVTPDRKMAASMGGDTFYHHGKTGHGVLHSVWVPESKISLALHHAGKVTQEHDPKANWYAQNSLASGAEQEAFVAPGTYRRADLDERGKLRPPSGPLGKARFGEHWHDAFHGWIEPSGKFHHMPDGVKTHGEHAKLLGHAHEEDAHRAGWAAVGHMRDNSATLPEAAKSDPSHPISRTLAGLVRGLPPSAHGIHVLGTRSEGWPAWYVPRERAEKGVFSKPSAVAEFHGKSEGLAKEMWGFKPGSEEEAKHLPFHGWISPEGEWHQMDRDQVHSKFIRDLGDTELAPEMPPDITDLEYESGYNHGNAARDAHWISVGHAGGFNVMGHSRVLHDRNHPATKMLAAKVKALHPSVGSVSVEMEDTGHQWDVPRHRAEKGSFGRPSKTQLFRSESLAKEMWGHSDETKKMMGPFHGWINPYGGFHSMHANQTHQDGLANFLGELGMPNSVKTYGEMDAHTKAGWIGTAAAGLPSVVAHPDVIGDPSHPSTRKLALMVRRLPENITSIEVGQAAGADRPYDVPRRLAEKGIFKRPSTTQEFRNRPEGLGKVVLWPRGEYGSPTVPEFTQDKVHGWISPEGHYHHMGPNEAHENFEHEGKTDRGLYDAGWLSLGHGGAHNVQGRERFLKDPDHPATRLARRLAGKYFGEKTLLAFPKMYGHGRPWDAGYMPTQEVNTRLWSKHGGTGQPAAAMFRSEGLGKIVLDRHYTGVDPAREPEGAHGWISPEGDYLPIAPDADHHQWIRYNEGLNEKDAHKAGWLSVGHGGEGNVQGHSAFLFNPSHPATRTARRIAGKHFGEKTLLHPSDEYYSVLPHPGSMSSKWVNTRLWSKHGRDTDVAESPQAMFRSEGELDKSARDWLAGTLAAASLMAPGQMHESAPKSPQHVQAAPSAPLFGQHPMDRFLDAIQQLESSGGKRTSHKPMRHGLHAGTVAHGPFAIMPATIKDIAGKAKEYPEVAALAAKTPGEVQQALASDHGLALQAARAMADHLHAKTGGDPDRMAHAWRHGAYANPTPEQVAEDPYVQAFRGHLDKSGLEKGSLQSKNKFNPGMIEPEDMVTMGDWQRHGGHPELRDTVRPMSGPARFRALHKLSAQTKTRVGQDGKREFLLHRGVDPDAEAAEVLDPKAGTVTHETVSSWTPHYEIAHQFARDYAHNAPKKEGKGYRPTVLSAWVHEDSVHNVPRQWGKLPSTEQLDQFLGDNPELEPEFAPKPVGPNRPLNPEKDDQEHEVLVAPHSSKVAHPAEVKRAAGYGALEDLDRVVNERAKGGTHASPAVRMMQKPVRDRLRATLAARKPGLQKSSGLITFPHYGVKGQHYTVGYADPKRTGAAIRRITGSKNRMFDAYRGVVSGNMRADQRLPYADRKVVTGLAPNADLGTQRHEDQHTVFLQIGQEHGRHTRRAVARRLVESIPMHHRELFHKVTDERTPSALPEQKDEEKICFLHSYLNSPNTRDHVHDVWEGRGVPARQVDRMVKDVYRHMQRAGQQIVPVEALDRPVEKSGLQKSSGLILLPHFGAGQQHYTVGYRDPKYTDAAVRRIQGKGTAFDSSPYKGIVHGRLRAYGPTRYADRSVVAGLNPANADLGTQRHEDQHTIFHSVGLEHGRDMRRAVATHLLDSIPDRHRGLFMRISDMAPSVTGAHSTMANEERIAFLHSYMNSPEYRGHVARVWGHQAREVDQTIKAVHRHLQGVGRELRPEHVTGLLSPQRSRAEAGPMADQYDVAPTAKKSEDESVELHHYSDHPGLTSIDPAKHGTGVSGNESKRKNDPEWVDRSYHYLAGSKPGDSLAAKKHRYTSRVSAKGIYDLGKDPDGHTKNAVDRQGFESVNVAERRVRDAGHIGFTNSKTDPSVVALFHPVHPARHEELKKYVYDEGNNPGGAHTHGWIDPSGDFHDIEASDGHAEWMDRGYGMGGSDAHAAGWISMGHAGRANVQGHTKFLNDPSHPATRTARRLAGQHFPEEMVVHYSDKDLNGYDSAPKLGSSDDNALRTVSTRLWSKYGTSKQSPAGMYRSEGVAKSGYGPRGMGQYDPAANQKRKLGNVADTETGIQGIKVKTGANASGGQGKVRLERQWRAEQKRNKRQPVKVYTPEERAALQVQMAANPQKKAEPEGHGLPKKFSILTHENPAYRVKGMKGKAKFEAALAGHKYERIAGKYAGKKENSYLVHDADPAEMERIGTAAGQESVLHSEGGKHKLVYTNGPNAGRHHAGGGVTVHAKEPADNYSTRDGKHFTLGLDFSKLHEPSKKAERQGHHLVPIQEGRRGKRIGVEERIRRLNYHLSNMYDAGQVRDLSPAEHTQLHRPFKKRDLDPKEGITISHHGWPVKEPHADNFYTEVQAHRGGEKVGGAVVFHTPEGMTVRDVRVDARYRRRGVASAMYQHAEETTGRKLSPDDPDYQSREGKAFWAQPKRKFGKAELRKEMYGGGDFMPVEGVDDGEDVPDESMLPFHGWISPKGKFHQMGPKETHYGEKIVALGGQWGRGSSLHDGGWISTGHSGYPTVVGHPAYLENSSHPATKALARMVRKLPPNVEEIEVGHGGGKEGHYVPRKLAERGLFGKPSTAQMFRSEGWATPVSPVLGRSRALPALAQMLSDAGLKFDPHASQLEQAFPGAGSDRLFEAARFLSNAPARDSEKEAKAMGSDDPAKAALAAYGLEDTKEMRRALYAVAELEDSSLDKAEKSDGMKFAPRTARGEDMALAANRALEAGKARTLENPGKFTSEALVLEDPETQGRRILAKPEPKRAPMPQGVEPGMSCSDREEAFAALAGVLGLGSFVPKAGSALDGEGNPWALIEMLPPEFRSIQRWRQASPGSEKAIFDKHLRDGSLHMWAVLDWVAGSCDRHGGNILADSDGNVSLIDNGSSMADELFNPAGDHATFIPYYLRYCGAKRTAQPEDTLSKMPLPPPEVSDAVGGWVLGIDPAAVMAAVAPACGMGIARAVLGRLVALQAAVSKSAEPACAVVNALWAGTGRQS